MKNSVLLSEQNPRTNAHQGYDVSHRHGHAQVHHLALRTCGWTQRLKSLPTTRAKPPRHKAVMGTPRCITCNFALLTGRNVSSHRREGARGTRQTSSHAHAEVHQLRHGTCHCTRNPKLMPTTLWKQSPQNADVGNAS